MEKRNKEMRASGVEVECTELNDLLLDVHRQQYQAEVKIAEASEANNKKFDKEREKVRNSTVIVVAFIRISEEEK